jgi:uncharacterized protein YbbC (DUF1343 family)
VAGKVRTGLDRLLEEASLLRGRSYGLLCHQASVTEDYVLAHLALARALDGSVKPRRLFGPEHGFYGVEQDMVAATESADPWTDLPVVSLYGKDEQSLRPRPKAFEGLDLLLIDLQDVGARYYTFVATAVWAAEVALEAGCEVWVLDRPNPLGGEVIEGNLLLPGFESFVGAFETPVRHGLTLAELVRLEGVRRGWPGERLRVFELAGWQRSMHWPDTGRSWLAPSPNMPSYPTAAIYPGGCLVEATEISEGRGTTRPFHLVGAPGFDAPALAAAMENRALPGLRFVPAYFRPQFQKHAGEVCAGVEVVVTDPRAVQGYRFGIELLVALTDQGCPWREAPYEFVSDIPAIDLLTGSDLFRGLLEARDRAGIDQWLAGWQADESRFAEERAEVLLY